MPRKQKLQRKLGSLKKPEKLLKLNKRQQRRKQGKLLRHKLQKKQEKLLRHKLPRKLKLSLRVNRKIFQLSKMSENNSKKKVSSLKDKVFDDVFFSVLIVLPNATRRFAAKI